jgi:tetratricopeptide (TPR) repeat protein
LYAAEEVVESHDHIVTRVPIARNKDERGPRDRDVEVINAWLWPSTDLSDDKPVEPPAAIEVSLLPKTRKLLRDFPAPGLEYPYLRHMEQRILRNPRDLLSHVRRILVADALRDTAATEGALADLFIILGSRGRPLRTRLLKLVAGELNTGQRDFFGSHLESGLDANEAMPELPQSRLSKHVLGTTQIVVRSGDENGAVDRSVGLARESMQNGRYDVAQAMLEGALESDPGDKEACEELLNLYERRNLRSSFFKTYTALLGMRLAVPERWARLAEDFQIGTVRDG